MDIAFFAPETWALFIRLYIYNNIVYSCAPNPTLIHNPKTVALCCCCSWWHLYDWSYIVKNTTYCDSTAAFASRGSAQVEELWWQKVIVIIYVHHHSKRGPAAAPSGVASVQKTNFIVTIFLHLSLDFRYFKTDIFVFYSITFYAPLQTVS